MNASNSDNTQSLPAGTHLHEFVTERVLGAGGFGITYLARDTGLNRQVVIKENLPTQFAWRETTSGTVRPRHSSGGDADDYAWSMNNFLREAETLASLDHPGIVRVLQKFEANGTAYFVMPFVEGCALDTLIDERRRKNKPFAEDELKGLLERLLDALAYLHDRGIYHRDIKPGNILISNDGIPALIDFGSARQRLSERSMTVIESAGYTPFEQLQSRGNVGPWSDLYALGATLVKAITFETVPKAADRVMGDPWPGLLANGKIAGHYSPGFLRSIERALAPSPDQRWQDARQWQEASHSDHAPEREIPLAEVATASIRADRGDAIEPRAEAADPFVAYAKPARQASKDTRNNLIGGACGLAVLGVVFLFLKNSGAERIPEQEITQKGEMEPYPIPVPGIADSDVNDDDEPEIPPVVEAEPEQEPDSEEDLPPGDPELLERAIGLILDARGKRDKELADNAKILQLDLKSLSRKGESDLVALIERLKNDIVDDRIPVIDGVSGLPDKVATAFKDSLAEEETIDSKYRADLTRIRNAYVTRLQEAAAAASDDELKGRLIAQAGSAEDLVAWVAELSPETVQISSAQADPASIPATRPEEPVATPPAEPAPQSQSKLVPNPKPNPKLVPKPVPDPSSGDIVAIMKASIWAGEIKEFTFEQVLEWQAGEGMEMINGQSCQTGIVSYKAETSFGVKTIQAKSLIQDGKVIRWLWPKSGMEIK